jgi:hypothetical protein
MLFTTRPDGSIAVEVHQVVHGVDGTLVDVPTHVVNS